MAQFIYLYGSNLERTEYDGGYKFIYHEDYLVDNRQN